MRTARIGGALMLTGIGVVTASVAAAVAGLPLTSEAPNGQLVSNTIVAFAIIAGIGAFGAGAAMLAADDEPIWPRRARGSLTVIGIGSIVIAACLLGAAGLPGPSVDVLIVPVAIAGWAVFIGALILGVSLLGTAGLRRRVALLLLGGIGLAIAGRQSIDAPGLVIEAIGAIALVGAAIGLARIGWSHQPSTDSAEA